MCRDIFFKAQRCGEEAALDLKVLYRGKIPRLSERVFVNVYGAQESIPPGIPGLLKRFTDTGSASISLLSIRSKRKQDGTCHKEREERWVF
jgi:hypothetical protein